MVEYDALQYPYPSQRHAVFARRGMACSTSPIVSQTGLDVMKAGGNAVDAAVAMAALMPLAEPGSNGLGSDCFALVWMEKDRKLYGLNASGTAPMALSAEKVRQRSGNSGEMPRDGWCPVTVPGAPGGWAALRRRFGTKSMEELMAPAVSYAEEGFAVPVSGERSWAAAVRRCEAAAGREPELFRPWFDCFTKNGAPYRAGETFRSPEYARTMRSLAATDCGSFYRGEIMEKIVSFSRATGGFFSEEDFESWSPLWVDPVSVRYRGYDVFELPPNGQGITVLMALNILEGLSLPDDRDSGEAFHLQIEALKLAFADTMKYVADPRTMRTRVEDLLSEGYADRRRRLVGERALQPEAGDPSCGGTVYFCTADGEGNMVSFIQSNYMGFGSGVVVPGTGISLQNRGVGFSLDPASDNFLEGGKRPYHTIIPGFLCRDGQAAGPFGVMGAYMQPQGHVQVLVNTLDYHMNPQAALDAPRFQWTGGRDIQLEREVPERTVRDLERRGHRVVTVSDRTGMGRGQIIWRSRDGTLTGGTEPRADGSIAAW